MVDRLWTRQKPLKSASPRFELFKNFVNDYFWNFPIFKKVCLTYFGNVTAVTWRACVIYFLIAYIRLCGLGKLRVIWGNFALKTIFSLIKNES